MASHVEYGSVTPLLDDWISSWSDPSIAERALMGDFGNLTGESDRAYEIHGTSGGMLSGAIGDYENAVFGDEGFLEEYKNNQPDYRKGKFLATLFGRMGLADLIIPE